MREQSRICEKRMYYNQGKKLCGPSKNGINPDTTSNVQPI